MRQSSRERVCIVLSSGMWFVIRRLKQDFPCPSNSLCSSMCERTCSLLPETDNKCKVVELTASLFERGVGLGSSPGSH